MEKFCPVCSRAYGENATTCDVDGERLVILREEPSLVGHELDDKYTLKAKIGEGGMGSVYLAEQSSMGREVAIKVLRREFCQNRLAIKRFLREARAASKLAHPNTITVYDFGQSNDGLLYLVMELLTGRPLDDIVDEDGAMSVERAVHIIAQVCDSLAEAHAAGITHRDLKPENIFIQQKVGNPDHVKVLDFGIAKMTGEDQTQATATGMICGTPAYMSPEQAMGSDIDGRSDIYGLGILFYELLTDAKPFEGDTPMEVMLKHINEPPPDIYQRTQVSVPIGIQEAIEQMLAKRAEDRPASCQALKQMLLDGLKTELVGPISSTSDPKVPKRRRADSAERDARLEKTGLAPAVPRQPTFDDIRPPRRTGSWLMLAAIIIVALGGGLAWYLSQDDQDQVDPAAVTAKTDGTSSPAAAPEAVPTTTTVTAGTNTTTDSQPKDDDHAPSGGAVVGEDLAVAGTGTVTGQLVNAVGPRSFELLAVAATPPEPELVVLTIKSEPKGAEIFLGDELLGTTPTDITREKDSGQLKLILKLDRYKDRTLKLDTSANVIQSVELKRRWTASAKKSRKNTRATDKRPKDPKPDSKFGTF